MLYIYIYVGDHRRAAELFLRLASDSLSSKLGAFSAKGYFLQAALCHLAAGDTVAAGNVLNTAKNTDFSFPSSRECAFVEQLMEVYFTPELMTAVPSPPIAYAQPALTLYCLHTHCFLQASENFNADDFSTACADFDRISPLDPFKTSMLVAVRFHPCFASYVLYITDVDE